MATKKKLLQAAAGNAGGDALNVEDVFSTYLYSANNAGLTITNGIDLAGEGGLVWGKSRSAAQNHRLYDTEGNGLYSNLTNGSFGSSGRFTANSDGFDLTASSGIVGGSGYGGPDYASWTFRKAPKFFTCLTYTGDGTVGRNISHNLGSKPGCVIVKKTSGSEGWFVSHRGYNNGANTGYLNMSNAFIAGTSTEIPVYYATDTTFRVSNISGQSYANTNGATYVAYLFAHNDGDGDFGPDGDADIIKCGSFTGSNNTTVNLGFEPQWILAKRTDSSTNGDWFISDVMRGWTVNASGFPRERFLNPNQSWQESLDSGGTNSYSNSLSWLPTSTGFKTIGFPFNSGTFIYIAIRRGTAVPESATEVFDVDTAGGTSPSPPLYNLGKPVDFALTRTVAASSTWNVTDRLRQGKRFRLPNTDAESALSSAQFDYQEGHTIGSTADTNYYSWMWKRAPNYFDVVAYTGNGTAGRTVSHNLGVAPEMMWVKRRDSTGNWIVYTEPTGNTDFGRLNQSNDFVTSSVPWNNTSPTSSVFTVGGSAADFSVNNSGADYIAYLFASLDGISKVGSYTGNGSSQTIDCGFTSGARFVLIKNTDTDGLMAGWAVFDTERGIVSGNDSLLYLNTTTAENTSYDLVDPSNVGFIVNQDGQNLNSSGEGYIFYAIA